MNILVIGAGRMGLGAAWDLAQQPDVDRVTVADLDTKRVLEVCKRIGRKAQPARLDVNMPDFVVAMMEAAQATISCVTYSHNVALAQHAVAARTNFCDLGGNNDIVAQELALDAEAKAAGINIIPDCGLAPGMVAVLVAHGAERFRDLEEIHIRVGGLPQNPRGLLQYQMVFSVEGLINEYVERARVIRDGRIVEIDSMTEVEELDFRAPFGKMEAFQTSGGTSTLPETFLGKVKELDYKTIRYPGHCEKFKTMIDLGLCSSEPVKVDGVDVKPRRLLGDLIVKHLPHDEPDVVLVRIDFKGDGKHLRYEIIDRADETTGLSAMMRTTAFPASIVALMMARGQTTQKGALPQERCIPPQLFMDELAKRNVVVEQSWV